MRRALIEAVSRYLGRPRSSTAACVQWEPYGICVEADSTGNLCLVLPTLAEKGRSVMRWSIRNELELSEAVVVLGALLEGVLEDAPICSAATPEMAVG